MAGAADRGPGLAGQPGAGPGAGRAVGRPARRRHRAAAARRGAPGAAPGRRGRALRRRPAHVHGLLRLPQPRAAPPPRASGSASRCPTAVDALRAELPDAEVVHERGLRGARRGPLRLRRRGRRGRAEADLCVAVVGDLAGLFGHGTSGEGCDAEDLRLPGVQADLLDELLATGTPVVVVVVSGRPYALGDVHGRAAGAGAGVHARRGGRGGDRRRAVRPGPARRQAARADPAAPGRPAGHLPAAAAGRRERTGISNLDPTPLFPFGYGRSYTTFEVDDLRISDTEVPTDGEFTVSVRVRNTGGRAGDEVVQLYLHDVARPGDPAGAAADRLRPGARWSPARAPDVRFDVHADRTAFTGRDLRRIVEPGDVEVLVGTSAADLPLPGRRSG